MVTVGMTAASPSKFLLYEKSVQNPNWQVSYLPQFHRFLSDKDPLSFREDFCGSGKIACEWAKLSPSHTAWGLDIDREATEKLRRQRRLQN